LGYVIFGIPIKKEKKTIITGPDNPTGARIPKTAHKWPRKATLRRNWAKAQDGTVK
jgi:hypothetical protein